MKKLIGLVAMATLSAAVAFPSAARAADPVPAEFVLAVIADLPPYEAGPVPFQAYVRVGSAPVVGDPVALQVKEAGASAFTTYATTQSDSAGAIDVVVRLRFDAVVRWYHPASAQAGASYSSPIDSPIRPRVGAAVDDRTLRIGQLLVIKGRINPAKPGRIVRLYAGANRNYYGPSGPPPVLLATARVAEDGSYRLGRRFKKAGTRHVYVEVPASYRNVAGWSTYRNLRIG